MNVLFWKPGDFPVRYSKRDTSCNARNRHSGSFMVNTGILFINMKSASHECWMTFWSLTNNRSNSPPIAHPWDRAWPPNYALLPWTICNGCGMPTGKVYPSGNLVPSPFFGLACVPIVETRFLEFAMSLLDFKPWMPPGTFSILFQTWNQNEAKITFTRLWWW